MNNRSAAFAALSGFLLSCTFPNVNIPALAWIAFIPLLLALNGRTPRHGFWIGGLMGIVFFCSTMYWIAHAIHEYGAMPLFSAVAVTLLLCAVLALFPALFGAALADIGQRLPAARFIAAPALWTALEFARTHAFTGLPWALTGYSQCGVPPLIQIADMTGIYGVSFLIVLVNAALASLISDRRDLRPAVVSILCVVLAVSYGYARLSVPEEGGRLTISLIQGNIEQYRKWDAAYRSEVFAKYQRLTEQALPNRPDLVIWPETSTPFYFNGPGSDDGNLSRELVSFVRNHGVPLLFGSPAVDRRQQGRIVAWNSAFLLSGDGKTLAHYRKLHLVPFGEYVPVKRVLFFVDKLVQGAGDFESGTEHTVMTMPSPAAGAPFGTVICYEIIFPDMVRSFARRGASFIVTITNDGWFGKSAAPYQHFSMAVFRAVENRMPVVRAANTGISGFIDSRGCILASTDIFTDAHLTASIRPGTERTFYTRYGDLFAYGCAMAALLMLMGRKNFNGLRRLFS